MKDYLRATDLHQNAKTTSPARSKVGIDDASASSATSRTAPSASSNRRDMRADTRRSTPSRSTAKRRRSSGTCTTCIACNTSTTATRGSCAAGVPSTSPMAIIPTWATGGSPASPSATTPASRIRSPTSHQPRHRQTRPARLPQRLRNAARADAILTSARGMGGCRKVARRSASYLGRSLIPRLTSPRRGRRATFEGRSCAFSHVALAAPRLAWPLPCPRRSPGLPRSASGRPSSARTPSSSGRREGATRYCAARTSHRRADPGFLVPAPT